MGYDYRLQADSIYQFSQNAWLDVDLIKGYPAVIYHTDYNVTSDCATVFQSCPHRNIQTACAC